MEIYYIMREFIMREFKIFDEKFMPTFDFQVNSNTMIQLYCQNNILTNKSWLLCKKSPLCRNP